MWNSFSAFCGRICNEQRVRPFILRSRLISLEKVCAADSFCLLSISLEKVVRIFYNVRTCGGGYE